MAQLVSIVVLDIRTCSTGEDVVEPRMHTLSSCLAECYPRKIIPDKHGEWVVLCSVAISSGRLDTVLYCRAATKWLASAGDDGVSATV